MNTGGNICLAAVSAVLSALFLSSNLPLSVGSSRTASRKAYFATSVCRHVLRGFQGHLSAQVLGRGAPDRFLDRLDLRGWNTFANFAHAPTATPGTAGAEAAVKVVLDAVLGETFAVHEAAFRRLHWEAWTLTAADLKREVDGTDEATPRKLPVAEIGARLQILTPKIAPLKLQGIPEPSHASINLFVAMLDEGRLGYVEWARLTTRDQEVMGASEPIGRRAPHQRLILGGLETQGNSISQVGTCPALGTMDTRADCEHRNEPEASRPPNGACFWIHTT